MSRVGLGIIGLGFIFNEYFKVISKINDFKIIGVLTKSNNKSRRFVENNKQIKIYNNIEKMMLDKKISGVLVLVNAEETFNVLKEIIPYKKFIFTEKPVGINYNETKILRNLFQKYKTPNMIGFNRRFYSIFNKGLKIINSKGGINSILIEGHERFWKIDKERNKRLLDNWIYANSAHTIDLLRFFGGEYKTIYSLKKTIKHKKGDHFSMILKSNKNIISTYISNWYSPGGWSVKLFGNGITIIFDPLEKGYVIDKNFKISNIEASKSDIIFKPGFYAQMKNFKLFIETGKLTWPAQDINDAFKTVTLIKKILQ
tara:strand:+ start:6114 stop:7055 length:942 start_codon:yes stop_codon:yes gene_type:complete